MAAVGARVQSEEMLPQMINTKPFLLQKMCFLHPGVVAPGFCQIGSQGELAAEVWMCEHHQEPPAQQLEEWGEAKERGPEGETLEGLWQRE